MSIPEQTTNRLPVGANQLLDQVNDGEFFVADFTKTNKGKFRKAENRTNRHVVILSSMYSF